MTNYFNRLEVKDKRRALRSVETAAETLLWERLRDRRTGGLKFRRQYSVGVYSVDFYCSACRLAVEVNGEIHASLEAPEYDAKRTKFLATLSIQVIRFPNTLIHADILLALKKILAAAPISS